MYCIRYPPQFSSFGKEKPLVCPNCYLLGKEIFVFKLLTLLTWLAGWLLLTAYFTLYPAAFNVLLTYSLGYEDDDVTVRYVLYVYLCIPM